MSTCQPLEKPKNRGGAPVFENTAEVGGTNAIDHIASSIFHVFFSARILTPGMFKVYIYLDTCLPFTRGIFGHSGDATRIAWSLLIVLAEM